MKSSLDPRRIKLARKIGLIIDRAVQTGVVSSEQEPAITGRISGALQAGLSGNTFAGFKVDVVTYQLPSAGAGALESEVGADLFIGVKLGSIDGLKKGGWEKGMLIQAKKEQNPALRSAPSPKFLKQCEDMLGRTSKGAYVWIYGRDGIKSISADAVVSFPNERAGDLISKNPAHLFRDVLACDAGDRNLGTSEIFGNGQALGQFAEQLRVPSALAINLWDLEK